MSTRSIKYSVVIPFKNEEENVEDVVSELVPIMDSLEEPWELLCIDDGSSDCTGTILSTLSSRIPNLKIISFVQNYGQSSAFDAGFRKAVGEYVITLDGDGQNDPQDILTLAQKIDCCDLVCGIRQKRRDPWLKRMISKLANFVRSRFCHDGVQDTGCSLKVYRRSCLEKIKMYHGMHRFLPALFQIEGFRVEQYPVNHRERKKGKTKYHFRNRSINTIVDMFAVRWMRTRQLKYQIKS